MPAFSDQLMVLSSSVDELNFRKSGSKEKQAAGLRHKSEVVLVLVLLSPTSFSSVWPQSKPWGSQEAEYPSLSVPVVLTGNCCMETTTYNYLFCGLSPFVDAFRKLSGLFASQYKIYSLWKQNKFTRKERRCTKCVPINRERQKPQQVSHNSLHACIPRIQAFQWKTLVGRFFLGLTPQTPSQKGWTEPRGQHWKLKKEN